MPRSNKYDILFEPIAIGPKTLKNRFYQVPHCTGFGRAKPWSQARHRSVKAEGGWGAVCTEFCAISPESDEAPYPAARLWDDGDVKALALMCDEAHAHGALAGVELHHGGVHAERRETRVPAVGPSQLGGDFALPAMSVPKAMDLEDIERVTQDWVAAAERARQAGFDIVYVYGGHTYLLGQFLSPFYNRRNDEYGGSLENRARLWLETLERVRTAVGRDCAIAVRLSADSPGSPSVAIDDALGFVAMADEFVDLWDLQVGGIAEWSKDSGASRFFKEGYQFEWTRRLRESTSKPIVGVGRLVNPDLMVDIVASGCQDIIGAARPSIADPFLPKKIAEGRFDEDPRVHRLQRLHQSGCVGRPPRLHTNATAGEEYRRGWHPEVFSRAANADKDVLIVGAGPAGMECATVLGKREMVRVHLVEASSEMGGCVRWISQLPGLGEWSRITNSSTDPNRQAQERRTDHRQDDGLLRRARVRSRSCGHRYRIQLVDGRAQLCDPRADPWSGRREAQLPDAGADPSRGQGGPGAKSPCLRLRRLLRRAERRGTLERRGHTVDLVTCFEQVAPLCTETLEGPMLRQRLHDLGVRFHRAVRLLRLEDGGAVGEDEFGDPVELEADAVVLVTWRGVRRTRSIPRSCPTRRGSTKRGFRLYTRSEIA